jgi:hypothetical protein
MTLPNPEFLSVPAAGSDRPPDASGEWRLLIADTFGPEGSLAYWTRRNPLHLSSLPPGNPPPADRLAFDLVPPLDPVAACDREILVSEDDWNSGSLIVVPAAIARRDRDHIRAILTSSTVGELRRTPSAWSAAADTYDNNQFEDDETPSAHSLPDDHPYEPYDWFGDEGVPLVLPLARLRTAQCAPACLDDLLRPDDVVGMDYEPAAWLDTDGHDTIIKLLRKNGYVVVHDEELARAYRNY